ncbi:MAG: MBL fold metallo-hydrolase [Rudaea sp.]
MTQGIRIITSGMGNCYLVDIGGGRRILVDTGMSLKRRAVDKELDESGCKPGELTLIVLTHGDSDHAGNAAFLRAKHGAKIAMHQGDSGMVERGDMAASRERVGRVTRFLFSLPLVRLGKSARFKPDLYLQDSQDLSPFGFDARVLHLPGHTGGSIGILTAAGDLFCGDLLINSENPAVNSLIDDRDAARASLEKLKRLEIKTVYPGHGRPFLFQSLFPSPLAEI